MDNAQIIALTAEVAKALGDGWKYTPEDSVYQTIQGENQASLSLHLTRTSYTKPSDRMTIGGSLNVGKGGSYVEVYEKGADGTGWNRASVSDITVAIARGPEAIAKEITRRFLPEYLRVLRLAQEKAKENNAWDAAVTANLKRLAQAAGTVVPTDKHPGKDVRNSLHVSIREAYGTIQASNNTAQLELRSLSIEQAEYILTYLAKK